MASSDIRVSPSKAVRAAIGMVGVAAMKMGSWLTMIVQDRGRLPGCTIYYKILLQPPLGASFFSVQSYVVIIEIVWLLLRKHEAPVGDFLAIFFK